MTQQGEERFENQQLRWVCRGDNGTFNHIR